MRLIPWLVVGIGFAALADAPAEAQSCAGQPSGTGITTLTTSTTAHETHVAVNLPGFAITAPGQPALAGRLIGALAGPQGSRIQTALVDAGLLGPPGPSVLSDTRFVRSETALVTTVTVGPATIRINDNQSQIFCVAAGDTNINVDAHTETFFDDLFQASRALTDPGANALLGDLHSTFQTMLTDEGFHFIDRMLARGRDGATGTFLGNGWRLWIGGALANAGFDGTASNLGFNYRALGGEVGIERDGGPWLIGASIGYGHARVEQDVTNDSGHVRTWRGGLYAAWHADRLALNGAVAAAWHDIDATRLSALASPARSSYDARTLAAGFEAVLRSPTGNGGVEPLAGMIFTSLHVGSFTESGVPFLNLAGAGATIDALMVYAGGRAWIRLGAVTPELRARLTHDLLDDPRGYVAHFADAPAGPSMPVSGLQPDRSAVLLGGGLAMRLGERARMQVGYDAELRGGDVAHRLSAIVDLNW